MNVLYTKHHGGNVYTANSVHASGDGVRCCRLCGGDTNLKYFRDTYVWEGNEERYDELLYDCFGITVTQSDSMICDFCIRGLRNMEKFKALVMAAFQDNTSVSDKNTLASSRRTSSCQTPPGKRKLKKPAVTIEQPKRKPLFDGTNKKEVNRKCVKPEVKHKRVNVQCDSCKQKYPLLVTNGENKPFTCARCKRNGAMRNSTCRKCNISMPSNMYRTHLDLHIKADHRGMERHRPNNTQVSKRLPPKQQSMNNKKNVSYLKTNTAASNLTTATFLCSKPRRISDDDMFYIIRDEDLEKKNSTEVDSDKHQIEFLFKRTQSLTKNSSIL